VALLCIVLIPFGYWYEWTGFSAATFSTNPNEEIRQPKRLWDWLELLVIPLVLAISAAWFSRAERRNEQAIANQRIEEERTIAKQRIEEERTIAEDRTQDAALQSYLEQMSILLIDKDLRKSEEGSEVRDLARAWTLTFLRRLNGERKGILLRFLYESELITKDKLVISLVQADLREAELDWAVLNGVDLTGANLEQANLEMADLSGAILFETYLSKANLFGAELSKANLSDAFLSNAILLGANLRGADLSGAYLDDAYLSLSNYAGSALSAKSMIKAELFGPKYDTATIWPDGFDPESHGAILIKEEQ